MPRRLRIQRKDGVVQRYKTTPERLQKKGYEPSTRRVRGHEVVVWVKAIPVEEPLPVEPEEKEVPSSGQPELEAGEQGLFEVTVYSDYRQRKHTAVERYELRTVVKATLEDAVRMAYANFSRHMPHEYHKAIVEDIPGAVETVTGDNIEAIPPVFYYDGVKYFRFKVGSRSSGALKHWVNQESV